MSVRVGSVVQVCGPGTDRSSVCVHLALGRGHRTCEAQLSTVAIYMGSQSAVVRVLLLRCESGIGLRGAGAAYSSRASRSEDGATDQGEGEERKGHKTLEASGSSSEWRAAVVNDGSGVCALTNLLLPDGFSFSWFEIARFLAPARRASIVLCRRWLRVGLTTLSPTTHTHTHTHTHNSYVTHPPRTSLALAHVRALTEKRTRPQMRAARRERSHSLPTPARGRLERREQFGES